MFGKFKSILFCLILFFYFTDSILNISLLSKRNLLFLIIIFIFILIYFLNKKYREVFLIKITTIFLTDIFYNIFLQDKFPNIKIKPLIKNSVQKSAMYLSDWPYFKFKPNITVQSYGDRGEDCIYKWVTDDLGFKNNEVKKNYSFIAIGNSYVEGMCSGINETFAYYLSEKNIPTYNLGVQGWSDKQSISALNIIEKENINYEGIIFGYLQDRFVREGNFIDRRVQKGGLGRIIEVEFRKGKSFFVTREILQNIFNLNKFNWRKEFSEVSIKNNFIENKNIKIREEYADLNLPLNYIPTTIRWTETANIDLNSDKRIDISNKAIFKLLKKMDSENKKFIIFIFPLRTDVLGHIIYEDGYICNTDYYMAYKRIHNNLKGNGNYIFLDMFDNSVELTKQWIKNRDYDNFIWKYKDPHYSKIGNRLIANMIEDYLINKNKGTKKYLKYCK